MSLQPTRRGFTLVEALISVGLATLLFTVGTATMLGGSRLFGATVGVLQGPDATEIFLARFEPDVLQTVQALGDPRPPMQVRKDGLYFYQVDPTKTSYDLLVGRPCAWTLVPATEEGTFHPCRNGEVLEELVIRSWTMNLIEPDLEDFDEFSSPSWILAFEIAFPQGSFFQSDYVYRGAIELSQPTSNLHHSPTQIGGDEEEVLVRLLPRPEDAPGFEGLGPPDEILLPKPRPEPELGDVETPEVGSP